MKTQKLEWISPDENFVVNLAPCVEGTGSWTGEYGYALALTHTKVRVLWDEGGILDVPADKLVFFADGGISESGR